MSNENEVILSCCNLTARYGQAERPVLHGISIEVHSAEIVGLLGPNGSGKSSMLNAMTGRLRILQGDVRFNGETLLGLTPDAVARRGVRLFPQGGHIFPDMTVEENLRVAASCLPPGQDTPTNSAYKWFPDLSPRATSRAGLLSGGQKQMLSLAMVLLYVHAEGPRVFLLDEPSGGLDPTNRGRLAEMLREARECHGVSVLIAEENAVFAKKVCDRYFVFSEPGRIQPHEQAQPLGNEGKTNVEFPSTAAKRENTS